LSDAEGIRRRDRAERWAFPRASRRAAGRSSLIALVALGVALPTPGRAAAAPITIRVSVSSVGVQGNHQSLGDALSTPQISVDGRLVAFVSTASNLVRGDTNGYSDVFVHDTVTGTTRRVDVSATGKQANGECLQVMMTPSGRYAVFSSYASNLVPGDTNGVIDIFLVDLGQGTIRRISTTSTGGQANGLSDDPAISADGTTAAFSSWASNLVPGDTNGVYDVFRKNLRTGAVHRIDVTNEGRQAPGFGFSAEPSLSRNGRYVAFVSESDLAPGGSNDPANASDVFVRDRHRHTTTLVSVAARRDAVPDSFSIAPTISANGRYVVFDSEATNLIAAGTLTYRDHIYLRDLRRGTTRLIDRSTDGRISSSSRLKATITPNARYAVFSAQGLDNPDDPFPQVFSRNLITGRTRLLSRAISRRPADGSSYAPSVTPSGHLVVFESEATDLVVDDTNGQADVFVRGAPRER